VGIVPLGFMSLVDAFDVMVTFSFVARSRCSGNPMFILVWWRLLSRSRAALAAAVRLLLVLLCDCYFPDGSDQPLCVLATLRLRGCATSGYITTLGASIREARS
jgi:hypothetical protein